MARNFKELQAKMSPESRAKSEALAREMVADTEEMRLIAADGFVTIQEAAVRLEISVDDVLDLICDATLQAVEMSDGSIVVEDYSIEQFLAG